MTTQEFQDRYLSHYLLLEKDFIDSFSYLTPDEDNYHAYSSNYLKLILALGSEIYVLEDILAKISGFQYDPDNNDDAHRIVVNNVKDIKSLEILFKENHITIKPWDTNDYPTWKVVYNKIKHERTNFAIKKYNENGVEKVDARFNTNKKWYQYANLENVIIMFSILHSLEMLTYKKLAEDNMKVTGEKEAIVPVFESRFKITNQDWTNIHYSGDLTIYGETVELNGY